MVQAHDYEGPLLGDAGDVQEQLHTFELRVKDDVEKAKLEVCVLLVESIEQRVCFVFGRGEKASRDIYSRTKCVQVAALSRRLDVIMAAFKDEHSVHKGA